MTATESPEPNEPSLTHRARSLRDTVVARVAEVVDDGKSVVTARLDNRRRLQLMQELGAIHFNAATSGGTMDTELADSLIAEIAALDAGEPSEVEERAMEGDDEDR